MTVKSQCELDSRIKSIDDVQTCLHYDDKYIGENGYFATDLSELSDLSGCLHSTLAQIIAEGAGDDIFRTPHDVDFENWGSRFFVPDSLLRPIEKKYRPFSIDDWKFKHSIGETIIYRYKGTYCDYYREVEVMYLGYVKPLDGVTDEAGKGELVLGNESLGLQNLFNNYEIWVDGGWKPFGVLEDD